MRSRLRTRARSLPRQRLPTARLEMRRRASRSRQDDAEVVLQTGDRGRVDAELRVELAHGGERPPLITEGDDLATEPGWHAGHCVERVNRGAVDIQLRRGRATLHEGDVDLAAVG